jgi:hypothetical protein
MAISSTGTDVKAHVKYLGLKETHFAWAVVPNDRELDEHCRKVNTFTLAVLPVVPGETQVSRVPLP